MHTDRSHSQSVILSGSDTDLLRDEARRLTASLNCMSADIPARPCGQCIHCRQIYSDTYPYLHTIVPTGKAYLIQVSQIEGLLAYLSSKAAEGQYKVAVLEDAHRMHEVSSNKLLKTLEEPPDKSMILLLTDKPQDLLPTIRSRCRLLSYAAPDPLPIQTDRELAADILYAIGDGGYRAVLDRAKFVAESRKGSLDVFLSAVEFVVRQDLLTMIHTPAGHEKARSFIEALHVIWQAGYLLDRNVNPLLVLENLFITLMKLPTVSG